MSRLGAHCRARVKSSSHPNCLPAAAPVHRAHACFTLRLDRDDRPFGDASGGDGRFPDRAGARTGHCGRTRHRRIACRGAYRAGLFGGHGVGAFGGRLYPSLWRHSGLAGGDADFGLWHCDCHAGASGGAVCFGHHRRARPRTGDPGGEPFARSAYASTAEGADFQPEAMRRAGGGHADCRGGSAHCGGGRLAPRGVSGGGFSRHFSALPATAARCAGCRTRPQGSDPGPGAGLGGGCFQPWLAPPIPCLAAHDHHVSTLWRFPILFFDLLRRVSGGKPWRIPDRGRTTAGLCPGGGRGGARALGRGGGPHWRRAGLHRARYWRGSRGACAFTGRAWLAGFGY